MDKSIVLSMSSLGTHGRLGNQCFQLASTLGLAEKHGGTAVFPAWEYAEYFDVSGFKFQVSSVAGKRIEEKFFHWHEWEIEGDCDVHGYLQSEKYFGSARLRFKEEFVEEVRREFQVSSSKFEVERETICIQIRRGDYVGNPNYVQIPITWYISALFTHFPNWRECNILITSDDIEYCRVHFGCLPNVFFTTKDTKVTKGKEDVFDMAVMSLCDHFILSNSSFGWWGAWLGERMKDEGGRMKESKIIHPGRMFAGKLAGNDIRDYWPERWITHDPEDTRIPLKDVTFTIPVTFDHLNRKQNLDLGLCLLQMAFDAKFVVCEQGGRKFEYTSKWAEYLHEDGKFFHRTKMLNDMANLAETDFIVNWDADVIIPPLQVWMAVELLRAGADMVFPYGGPFARVPREKWFQPLEKYLDIGIVKATPFKGREAEHFSVGGAVLFNKDAFMDGGMENQNMVSYGPEDVERYERFKRLGYDIRRASGALFHVDHWTGPNSSRANPHYKHNHEELAKVRSMTDEQLREYVDTWSWRNQYTSRYYHRISEGAVRSAKIVMEAVSGFRFQASPWRRGDISGSGLSVIDVGCGVGQWNNGNPNYVGVDYRIKAKDLLIPPGNFIECDLNAGTLKLDRKFDLCLCLEVAEHLRPERAEALVEMLCKLSDRVLFSAAIPFQGGKGHINCQWQSWWAELFERNGFGAAELQPDLSDQNIELWYRQNMVLYERGAKGRVRDFVLPEYYVEIVKGARGKDEG